MAAFVVPGEVDDAVRRSRIGAALVAAAEAWAFDSGAASMSLASRRAGDSSRALDYEDSAILLKKTLHAPPSAPPLVSNRN